MPMSVNYTSISASLVSRSDSTLFLWCSECVFSDIGIEYLMNAVFRRILLNRNHCILINIYDGGPTRALLLTIFLSDCAIGEHYLIPIQGISFLLPLPCEICRRPKNRKWWVTAISVSFGSFLCSPRNFSELGQWHGRVSTFQSSNSNSCALSLFTIPNQERYFVLCCYASSNPR